MSLCSADLILSIFREIFFCYIKKKKTNREDCLISRCSSRVPKTTFIGRTHSYGRRMQIKTSKGKRLMGQHPRPGKGFQLSSPRGVMQSGSTNPSNTVCQQAWSIAKRESSTMPWNSGFHYGQAHRHGWLPTWPAFISGFSKGQADIARPRPLDNKHTLSRKGILRV